MKHQAAAFDIDGTLVDSVDLHAQCWKDAFEHFGTSIPYASIRQQIGKGGDQLVPVFWDQAMIARLGDELERYHSKLFLETYLPQVKPFPKVRDLLQEVRQSGYILCLATSAKKEEADFYKNLIDIRDLVDVEVTGDDVERSKPCPDIFLSLLEKLHASIDAAQVLMTGDTPYDAVAAAKAGVKSIGVLCGGFPASSLRDAGCMAVYQDPADLLANFEESPFALRTKV